MIATQLKKDEFYLPIIWLLDGLGGSASIKEIEQKLIEKFAFTDEDLAVAHEKSGTPIIPNKIAWSRSYLKEACLLANERRGVWVLTEDGRKALDGGEGVVRERVANAMREYQARRKAAAEASAAEEVPRVEALFYDGVTTDEVTDWRDQLLAALKAICASATLIDSFSFNRFNGLSRRSALGPHADTQRIIAMSAAGQNVAAQSRVGSCLIASAAPEVVPPLANDGSYSLRLVKAEPRLRRPLSSAIKIRADHA